MRSGQRVRRSSGIPLPTNSREQSPSRTGYTSMERRLSGSRPGYRSSNGSLTHTPRSHLMAEKMLHQSKEAESALADALASTMVNILANESNLSQPGIEMLTKVNTYQLHNSSTWFIVHLAQAVCHFISLACWTAALPSGDRFASWNNARPGTRSKISPNIPRYSWFGDQSRAKSLSSWFYSSGEAFKRFFAWISVNKRKYHAYTALSVDGWENLAKEPGGWMRSWGWFQ